MQLVIYPFYSQQNKRTKKFRLSTCGAAKQMAFVAEMVQQELGWETATVVPEPISCEDESPAPPQRVSTLIPPNNAQQRVNWNLDELYSVFSDADIALLNHETMATPVRALYPKLPIISMCNVPPGPLDFEAWKCSSLVVLQGPYQAREHSQSYWSLSWDERLFKGRAPVERDIDVLFLGRCSESNYAHHREFLEAMKFFPRLRTVFVDVTRNFEGVETMFDDYIGTLHRSRVAVSLVDRGYGGLSIREAVRAGCTPVVLSTPSNEYWLGGSYPYFCTLRPDRIAMAVLKAWANEERLAIVDESYQAGWPQIRKDLTRDYSR